MGFKNQILAVVWLGMVLASIGACYKVYIMDRNYQVLTLTECDPEQQACFTLLCDDASESYNEDLCRQVSLGEKRYFSFVRKVANNIASCDARYEECPSLGCTDNEPGCEVITCNNKTLERYGDESMSCTPEVVVPAEPNPVVESTKTEEKIDEPAPPTREESTFAPSAAEEAAADAEQRRLDAQEESSLRSNSSVDSPAPTTIDTPPAPVDESLVEPVNNLPI